MKSVFLGDSAGENAVSGQCEFSGEMDSEISKLEPDTQPADPPLKVFRRHSKYYQETANLFQRPGVGGARKTVIQRMPA